MKKLLAVSALLAATLISAQEYKYEITPLIGYDIAEGNLGIDNQFLIGAAVQYNDVKCLLKPELSILYTDADYENSNISTDIYRIALNGVYEYDSVGFFTPLAKIGVGYETIDKHLAQNKDSIFFDAGVGAKIPLVDNIAIKLEAIYMLKNNDNRWDNNLALLAGLNFAFGPKSQPEPEIKSETQAQPQLEAKPEPKPEPQPEVKSKPIDKDDDNDGILNSKDKCPNTPAGNTVDDEGCTKIVNLHINFETASYKVDEASKQKVADFANFLKARVEFNAKILGHTDSVGTEINNQILSQNRADAVMKLLVKEGIDTERIIAVGMGENSPLTTNDTAEGKAQNRRIEAELFKNK